MSYDPGQVLFPDGKVMFYAYGGCCDVVSSDLVEKEEYHWNMPGRTLHKCICGRDESVVIFTEYGGCFYWEGRACRFCKIVTKGNMPYDEPEARKTIKDGIPEWAIPGLIYDEDKCKRI